MKYAFLVAWREYIENIKTKGFWIGILVFPTILTLTMNVPVWLEKKGMPVRQFVLVDQSGQFERTIESDLASEHRKRVIEALRDYANDFAATVEVVAPVSPTAGPDLTFKARIDKVLDNSAGKSTDALLADLQPFIRPGAPPFEAPRRRFERVPLPEGMRPDEPLTQLAEGLRPYLKGSRHLKSSGTKDPLYAAILIPESISTRRSPVQGESLERDNPAESGKRIEYWAVNLADQSLRTTVEQSMQKELRRREYQARGFDPRTINEIEQMRISVASFNPKKERGQESVGRTDVIRQWAPTAFVYLLWVAIFSIAQMLLNNTIEEKSNRIIEVLLSSVTAGELMMGKLAGIAAVGLTMVGAWLSTLIGVLLWKTGGQSEVATQMFSVLKSSNLIPAFILYFLLGYVMYAGLILAIGSMCNTLKEAQNYMAVITMIMMVPLMTMTFIPRDPNGTLATVLSWIPFYTPFVMMNRATADPPLRDVVGTIILLALFTALVLWTAVKIFRVGVLRTGQPPKLIELWRWIRSS
jgi:ABC-2 type transport system permease protein